MTRALDQAQTGIFSKQLTNRYAEYAPNDQTLYYPYYETVPPSQVHHVTTSKHHYHGGNQKNNAAMSALTLLAFLFFLHILQQCLRDHMTSLSTPQVMIVASGKESENNIDKMDKSGVAEKPTEFDEANIKKKGHNINTERLVTIASPSAIDDAKHLTKITTKYSHRNEENKYKQIFNH